MFCFCIEYAIVSLTFINKITLLSHQKKPHTCKPPNSKVASNCQSKMIFTLFNSKWIIHLSIKNGFYTLQLKMIPKLVHLQTQNEPHSFQYKKNLKPEHNNIISIMIAFIGHTFPLNILIKTFTSLFLKWVK